MKVYLLIRFCLSQGIPSAVPVDPTLAIGTKPLTNWERGKIIFS